MQPLHMSERGRTHGHACGAHSYSYWMLLSCRFIYLHRVDTDPGQCAGVSFSVDAAAASLLSVSGQQVCICVHQLMHDFRMLKHGPTTLTSVLQVNFDNLALTNLTLQQLNVLNVSDGTYNFTNSNVIGAQTPRCQCLDEPFRAHGCPVEYPNEYGLF